MGKCLHPTCSFETSPFPVRGRFTLRLKDPSEECDTEIPFLPGCEWRWPPVSCRPQRKKALAMVRQGANPQPPCSCKGQCSSNGTTAPSSPSTSSLFPSCGRRPLGLYPCPSLFTSLTWHVPHSGLAGVYALFTVTT